jgi:hypothetical protein
MAFRLISNNGGVTYASFADARAGDIASAGALIWTVDQAGDGGAANLAGMAYASLLITVIPSIRHAGQKVSDLSTVAHTTGIVLLARANTIVEWMTIGGAIGEFSFQNGSGTAGIIRNCVFQATTFCGIEVVNTTTPVTAAFTNCAFYDDALFNCLARNITAVSDVVATANVKHCSSTSTQTFLATSDTDDTSTSNAHATINAVNCVSVGSGFGEDRGTGILEHSVCNTTNCVYVAGGRSVTFVPVTEGIDTNPTISTLAAEFVSATDLISAKAGAERNQAGASAGVAYDILGVAYGTPPSIGCSALLEFNPLTIYSGSFAADDVVRLSNSGGALPAGLEVRSDYYVVSASGSTIELAESLDGDALVFTDAGTGIHFIGEIPEPIRQAMKLIAGDMYENREASSERVKPATWLTVERLLWPLRVMEMA